MACAGRIDSLARRVRWLDRYRRMLAVLAALVAAPLLIAELSESLGAQWPRMHATALSVMVGVGVWCVTEIVLAWITAVWETEHCILSRERGLPRAIVRRRP